MPGPVFRCWARRGAGSIATGARTTAASASRTTRRARAPAGRPTPMRRTSAGGGTPRAARRHRASAVEAHAPGASQYNAPVDSKLRPNHAVYLRVLRAMTPEQRLRKAFELTVSARALFAVGLRRRFPEMDDAAFARLLRERLDGCHNRNY